MYNRIYSGGNVRVPPDYGGNAIKYHPAEQQPPRQTFSPPPPLLPRDRSHHLRRRQNLNARARNRRLRRRAIKKRVSRKFAFQNIRRRSSDLRDSALYDFTGQRQYAFTCCFACAGYAVITLKRHFRCIHRSIQAFQMS